LVFLVQHSRHMSPLNIPTATPVTVGNPVYEESIEELEERLRKMKEAKATEKHRQELLARKEEITSFVPEALFYIAASAAMPRVNYFGIPHNPRPDGVLRGSGMSSPEQHEKDITRLKIAEVLHMAFSQIQKQSEDIAELRATIQSMVEKSG